MSRESLSVISATTKKQEGELRMILPASLRSRSSRNNTSSEHRFAAASALVLGICYTRARPLSATGGNGSAYNDCRNPGHDRHYNLSHPVRFSRRRLCASDLRVVEPGAWYG